MEKLESEIVLNSVHPYLMPFRVTKKDACSLLSIGIDKLNIVRTELYQATFNTILKRIKLA